MWPSSSRPFKRLRTCLKDTNCDESLSAHIFLWILDVEIIRLILGTMLESVIKHVFCLFLVMVEWPMKMFLSKALAHEMYLAFFRYEICSMGQVWIYSSLRISHCLFWKFDSQGFGGGLSNALWAGSNGSESFRRTRRTHSDTVTLSLKSHLWNIGPNH